MSTERQFASGSITHRDRGLTLPELLITVSILGLIMTVLGASIMVTMRQASSTQGRANLARSEQNLDLWLPADLASIDTTNTTLPSIDTDPAASPCGSSCPSGLELSGANALQLAWKSRRSDGSSFTTRVQYQYIQVGAEWQLQRIECSDESGSMTCGTAVVLHDLAAPPDIGTWNPDTTSPTWIFTVAEPDPDPDLTAAATAKKIIVTIHGGGDAYGSGGGQNVISLTAGGVTTREIDADEFNDPSFIRSSSRCGGPVTLIVDNSGSIGATVMDNVVAPGVAAFVEAFRGTPTEVQVIQFGGTGHAVGSGSGWHNYVDMSDDAAVDLLLQQIDDELTGQVSWTNWEEAFFHTFKNSDGTDADTIPKRVVFFTDGIPNRNRIASSTRTGTLVHYNAGPYNKPPWNNPSGGGFHQESFDRADVILDEHRADLGASELPLIFVGVGDITLTSTTPIWKHTPGVYTDVSVPPVAATIKSNRDVLSWLLTDGPDGEVEATYSGGEYTNADTANLYLQSTFDATAFSAAMKATALKDCGGTLTFQTRFADGSSVPDEIVFENTMYRKPNGEVVDIEDRTVTTSSAFRTGTFDFEHENAAFLSVDVNLQGLETLSGFNPANVGTGGWICRAGSTAKTPTLIPLDGLTLSGITVDVAPNEAVSCVLTVERTP